MKQMRSNAANAEGRRDASRRRRNAMSSGASLAVLAVVAICASTNVDAGPAAKGNATEKLAAIAPSPLAELRVTGPLAAQYCAAARDAIGEARYAQQAVELERLAKQADERLVLIGKRSAELREWIAKRDDFIASATAHLVAIYAAMRPESASEQLVRLDISTAAAILSKLDVRAASAILNDMPAEKAARLTAVIAGSARKGSQENQ